jgi:hypothetical protein
MSSAIRSPASDNPERHNRFAVRKIDLAFHDAAFRPRPEVGLRFLTFFIWDGEKLGNGENNLVPKG